MSRFKVDFNGVMDRLEELERENDLLRAREQALEAENDAAIDDLKWQRDINQQLGAENEQKQTMIDAMRPVVEAVANSDNDEDRVCFELCAFELVSSAGLLRHTQPCVVQQARAFVAAHPATVTAAGERDSAGGDDE